MNKIAALAVVSFALFTSGCGGHQSLSPTPPSLPQSLAAGGVPGSPDVSPDEQANIGPLITVTASVILSIPTTASAAKSVSITVNGGTPVVANTSSGSLGCVGSNPLVCTVSVKAPTSSDQFSIKTFNASNGTGTVLATGNALQAITTTNKTVKITLAGTPNSIVLALKTVSPRECNPSTNIPLFVAVKDSAGEIIVTSNYGLTITLHDADATGTTVLSTTTVTSSSTTAMLAYNGDLLKSATISATAPGITAVNVHNAVLSPSQMLYVLDLANHAVDVFPSTATGNIAPTRRLKMTGPDNGSNEDVLTSNCTIFVSDSGSTLAAVFSFAGRANGTVLPVTEITGTKTELLALGVAINPTNGKIYSPIQVSSTPGIGIWPPNANGNVAPAASIIGSKTSIGNPSSLAFDSSGKLYVLAFRNILVFATGAAGNVAPVQNLSTGFFCPDGVAVDATDQIYVSDNCAAEVKIWAKGATGNAAPLRTIQLPGSGDANGVGVDYANDTFTADLFLSTVYSFGPTANGKVPPRTTISGANTTLFEPNYLSL